MKKIFTTVLFASFICGASFAQTVSTVTTSTISNSYGATQAINVKVTFSAAVDVVAGPEIQLNVAPTTRFATVTAAAGVTVVNFTYTVVAGDNSARLDYASTGALTLNGGTIFAAGTSTPASLALPALATSGLYTTNIVIDTSSPIAFTTGTVTPVGGTVVAGFWNASNTSVNVIVPIDNADNSLTGGTVQLQGRISTGSFATLGSPVAIAGADVTAGTKTLSISALNFEAISLFADTKIIQVLAILTDKAGNTTTGTQSPTNTTVDQTAPTVTLDQDPGPPAQPDPAFATPVLFRAVFSEPITVASFTTVDVTLTGTATGKSVTGVSQFNPPNDGTTFEVDATATGSGTIIAAMAANAVTDPAGNGNTAATFTDKTVTFTLEPTTNPASISFSGTTQTITSVVVPAGGNATTYLLVARKATAVSFTPGDGNAYTSTPNFSAGTEVGPPGDGNIVVGSAAGPSPTFPVSGLLPNTQYFFALYGFNGAAATANYFATAVTNNVTTTACAYPAAPTGFGLTHHSTKIDVAYTRATNVPYALILANQSGTPPTFVPVDGVDYSAGANLVFTSAPALGDGFVVYANEPDNNTSESITVTGLTQNTQYSFTLYLYDPSSFCYKATSVTGSSTTTGPQAESTVGNAAAEPGIYTINATNVASTGSQVFQFAVTDPGVDGANTLISALTINADNPTNTIDWSQAIAGAQLSDGTNSMTVTAGANITASTIVFSGINTSSGQLGFINDGSGSTTKTYTLKIWLNSTLPLALQQTIDGLVFSFKVSNASFTTAASGSGIAPAQSSTSSQPTVVNVVASVLTFKTDVPLAATVTVPFGVANQPILEAKDAFGNYDLATIAAVVTTTPVNLIPNSPPAGFSNGTMDFSVANTFNYQGVGAAKMVVTTASPALTVTSTNTTVVSSTTTLGAAVTGLATSPLINSTTGNSVLGFSLVTNGGSLNVTALTITTVSSPVNQAPDQYFVAGSYKLFGNAVDNFATATTLGVSGVGSVANQITFSSVTIPINTTIKYFYLVADVKANFPTLHPTIQLSIATGGVTVAGTVNGSTQTSATYQFNDNTPPTILVVTRSLNTVYGTTAPTLTQAVTVQFSEPMDHGTTPTITLSPADANFTPSGGSWTAADTYSINFVHSGTQEQGITETVVVTSPSGAKDIGGNNDTGNGASTTFIVDNKKPSATVTVTPATITTNNLSALSIKVVYDESMNNGVNPTIAFTAPDAHLIAGTGLWSTTSVTNDTYTIGYTDNNTLAEEIGSTTVVATAGQDVAGNIQNASPASNAFAIDNKRPTVVSVLRNTPATANYINLTSVVYAVTFSEAVTGVDLTDFVATVTAGTPTTGAIAVSGSGTSYLVTVNSVGGNGSFRLDVNAGGITDVPGNIFNTAFTGGQSYNIDNTPPVLASVLPINAKLSVPIDANLTLTLTEANNVLLPIAGKFFRIKQTSNNAVIFSIDAANAAISIAANVVTINPPSSLSNGTAYYVEVDPGAITDQAGNAYAGFSGNTTWGFTTYNTPQLDATDAITETVGTTAACVAQQITINGKFFTGYTTTLGITIVDLQEITSGTIFHGTGITYISDTQIKVTVPGGIAQKIRVNVHTSSDATALSNGVSSATNPAGASGLSPDNADVGATAAGFSAPSIANVCNDGFGTAPTAFSFTIAIPTGTASSYTIGYTENSVATTLPHNAGATETLTPGVNIPATSQQNHDYQLTSVTDNFGCPVPPAGISSSPHMNVEKWIRSIPVIAPINPIVLTSGGGTQAVNGTITGSITNGVWSSTGLGNFTADNLFPASPSSRTYNFALSDYTHPSITFTLATPDGTGSNVCKGNTISQVVPISGTPLGNDICSTVDSQPITGFVSGTPATATLSVVSRIPAATFPGHFSNGSTTSHIVAVGAGNKITDNYIWSNFEKDSTVEVTIRLTWTDVTTKTDDQVLRRQPSITMVSPATQIIPEPSDSTIASRFYSTKASPDTLSFSFSPPNPNLASEVSVTGSGILFNSNSNKWAFIPSALAPGNYFISAAYNKNGCSATKDVTFNVFTGGLRYLTSGGLVPDQLCVNSGRVTIKLDPANQGAAGVTNIFGAIIESFDGLTKTAVLNPGLVSGNFTGGTGVAYTVTYTTSGNNLVAQVITINPKPTLDFPNIPPYICSNDNNIILVKGPNNPLNTPGTDFSFFARGFQAPVKIVKLGSGANPYYLDAAEAESLLFNLSDINDFSPKPVSIAYRYKDSNGCSDTTTIAQLNINIKRQPPLPVVTGINGFNTICVSSNSAVPSVSISTASYANNGNSPNGTIIEWSTDPTFPSSTTTIDNSNNFNPASLALNTETKYYVRQTNPTTQGCSSDSAIFFYQKTAFKNFPISSTGFTTGSISFPVNLSSMNSSITEASIKWRLHQFVNKVDKVIDSLTSPAPSYTYLFQKPDSYNLQSIFNTTKSCSDTLALSLIIVGQATVSDVTSAYQQTFGKPNTTIDPNAWVTPFGSGWEKGVANKQVIQTPGDTVWVTSLALGYPADTAFVYSPLLNLSGLSRPMMSLDTWFNSHAGSDGTVLEYSTDGLPPLSKTKKWTTVGYFNGGINWYNTTNLQARPGSGHYYSSPGATTRTNGYEGWSGTESAFQTSSFILDGVVSPLTGGPIVIFRMGFGSLGVIDPAFDGFAFDNVYIGNRTRTVLIENFTNSGGSDVNENNAINQFVGKAVGTQSLLINYHLGFPATDPFNQDNPADPSARALFYNIEGTPLSRLDGDNGNILATINNKSSQYYADSLFSDWGFPEYGIRTLQLSQATIDLAGTTILNDSIVVKAKVTPLIDLDKNTVLHIAIVENFVSETFVNTKRNLTPPAVGENLIGPGTGLTQDGFKSVLKKMLPDARGTKVGVLTANSVYTFNRNWTPDPAGLYPIYTSQPTKDSLSVIVFLQNDSTREVYQADIVPLVYTVPSSVTGLEPISSDEITVYPNPADQQLTIQLPATAAKDLPLQVVDQMGRVVQGGVIGAGLQRKVISTSDMSAGLYIIQLGGGNGSVTRKKVIIVHNK